MNATKQTQKPVILPSFDGGHGGGLFSETVWVVMEYENWEGGEIMGAYSTPELAEEARVALVNADQSQIPATREVHAITVDSPPRLQPSREA